MANIIKIHDRRFNKIWLGAIILITCIIGIGAWWFISHSNQKMSNKNTKNVISVNTYSKGVAQKITDARKSANNGDAADATAKYDEAIKAESDTANKSYLTISKAIVYYNQSDYQNALTTAKEAFSIYQSDVAAKFIANVYEQMGDKQNAIEYYQKAITLVDKSSPIAGSDIEYYQSKVNELGGS